MLLLGGLAFGCSDHDSSVLDPTVIDPNPPGFGGSPDRLNSTGGSGGESGTSDGGSGGTEDVPEPVECTIAFVTPSPTDLPHTFGPGDDRDGIACGASFSTSVVVSTSGASVALFVDGNPWASQRASSSAATFSNVVLGTRTPTTSSLRAVASMDDGRTCEATVDSLGVDCAGPTCVLIGPNSNAWLTSADDLDGATGGLQTNFQLQTDAENAGREAQLILNGDANTTVTGTFGQGDPAQALFANVTLTEGSPRTVQGVCQDAEGNVTLSSLASWSVTLAACEVAFVAPEPGEDAITFGPEDDEDGEACGTDFTTHVDVTTNGSSLTLFVDNQPVQTLPPSAGAARFENVVLGSRTPLTSTLKIQATMPDGRTCEVTRESLIVDCEGPSCTLVGPSTDPALNSFSDGDALASGVQADFRVLTNAENLGQPIRLIIDDNVAGALEGLSEDDNGATRALYEQVTLAEGPVRKVQAECEDALGNVTRSQAVTWLVDVTACGIGIDSIAGGADPITRLLDTSPGGDIQVPALGTLSGSDCTGVRVGVCGQSLGSFSATGITGSNWSTQLTLVDVNASGQACAEVQDAAGNVAEARQNVSVRSSDPAVALATPAVNSAINVAGTSGAVADLVPASASCEATFVVNCTDVDASVTLLVDTVPVGTPQTCLAVNGLTPPYLGQATFSSVSLASQNGGETYSITAQQTVAGLVGTSAAVLIGADCEPPVLALSDPACGSQLNLDTDDAVPGGTLQHDVSVSNGGVPAVQLTVTRQSGAPDVLSSTGNSTTTTFSGVEFGAPGNVTLAVTATDPAGNVSNASCQVTVVVAPTVDILVPAASALLTTTDDCDLGSGYGITVSGNTSAAAGSDVDVAVGAGSPVAFAAVADGGGGPNTFSGCLPIGDGSNQTLTVTVTEGVNPPGSDTVTVNVDTLGPTDPVAAATVSVVSARQGTVKFTWNHVEDSGGGLLTAYEMHCAPSAIVDETGWAVADATIRATGATRVIQPNAPTNTDLGTVPAAASAAAAQETLGSFRVGTTEFCVIRGRDQTGALTPLNGLSGNATVTLDFVTQDYTTVANANSSFTNVIGLGDINNDGADDMMYGVTNQGYQIFFGGKPFSAAPAAVNDAHPFDATADITINNGTPSVSAFGAVMAPLGDVNSDGFPDFAVSARAFNGNRGTVFVFFGKATDSWNSPPTTPVTINAAAGGCGADVCLVGSVAGAFFGWDITGTNFDGSGPNDVVVSARANGSGAGSVYVILGGTQFNVPTGTIINVPSGNPNGFVINAPASRSNFGVAVAAVGNGTDGRGDLAIGANAASTANPAALFYLAGQAYPGASTGLVVPSASSPLEVAQGSSGDYAAPVRAVGDFDGDGFGDLALGRNFSAGGGLGVAELYLRNDSTPNTFSAGPGARFQFTATGTDSDYGTFIATGLHPSRGSIGDLDGDGATELAVGTLNVPGGSATLFYGSKRPAVPVARTRASADFTLAGSATGIMVPNFVGDIDHDGFNDLAIVEGGSGTDHVILLH